MNEFTINVSGLKELDAKLLNLSRNGARRALSKGLRQGANIITKDARQRARVKSGRLKKSIKTKNEGLRNDEVTFSVQTADRKAHLIEHGHLLVKGGPLNAGGHVVGWVPAYPFLRPAAENNATQVVEKVMEVTGAAIEQEALKA